MPTLATRVAARTLHLLPRKQLSRGLGGLAALGVSPGVLTRAVQLYVRAYRVDLSEAVVPEGGFRSFDDFFTRALVDGARPIAGDERVLVSPADGRVEDAGEIRRGARIRVKGYDYSVGELVGDPADGERFEGGRFAVVYLSPRDYHRVHAPVGGAVHTARHVGGTLLPVNAFGVAHYPGLFARNERVAIFQQSEALGEVATVMVGAVGVGRISVSFDSSIVTNVGRGPTTVRYGAAGPRVSRGEELGKFHLGSTAIVLTGPDHPLELTAQARARVRMGEPLAHLAGGASPGSRGATESP